MTAGQAAVERLRRICLALPGASERASHGEPSFFAGSGTAGPKRQDVSAGNLVVFGAGDRITLQADARQDGRSSSMEVLLLGGEPIREPMVHYGPFVMNTRDELVQALEDYQAGRLGVIPPDAIMPHVPRNARDPRD